MTPAQIQLDIMNEEDCYIAEESGQPVLNIELDENIIVLTARIDVVKKKIDVLTRKVATYKIQKLSLSPRSKYSNINSRLLSPTAVRFIRWLNQLRLPKSSFLTYSLWKNCITQASINGRKEKYSAPNSPYSPSIRNSRPFKTSNFDLSAKPQVASLVCFQKLLKCVFSFFLHHFFFNIWLKKFSFLLISTFSLCYSFHISIQLIFSLEESLKQIALTTQKKSYSSPGKVGSTASPVNM
jgi:hypothetical protein